MAATSRAALDAKIAMLSTTQILEAVTVIGGSMDVSTDQRLVRALLIDEFARREGADAADVLMDHLGL